VIAGRAFSGSSCPGRRVNCNGMVCQDANFPQLHLVFGLPVQTLTESAGAIVPPEATP